MAELDDSNNYYCVTECAVDSYRILAEPPHLGKCDKM